MSLKSSRFAMYAFAALLLLASSNFTHGQNPPATPGLVAHEWGTFTSIAGKDGRSVDWLPLNGSTDLPGFVEHFRDAGFKLGLSGTVRMETPVLYFYSPRETTISVKVAFSKGVLTEWYPCASRVEPAQALNDASLYAPRADGQIAWDSVTVQPNQPPDFPREKRDNHYYAARATSAAPLRVNTSQGEQREKFLFYRGVANFSVPISATVLPEGKLLVGNLGYDEIPAVILFERRGEKLGYRVSGALRGETVLDPPNLTGSLDSLSKDLEKILVAQGLFPDEAHAMLESWRHSWFEEGSRLLYIVPERFVNTILPLSISPPPARTVRVFVGRLEVVTPATQRAVANAYASHDRAVLAKYGRFLEPILKTMMQQEPDPARLKHLREYLDSFYSSDFAVPQSR